jgi:hypothetical protein
VRRGRAACCPSKPPSTCPAAVAALVSKCPAVPGVCSAYVLAPSVQY